MNSEQINKEVYIKISKYFLILYLNTKCDCLEDQQKIILKTFDNLENESLGVNVLKQWHQQVKDLSIRGFVSSYLSKWKEMLLPNLECYQTCFSFLEGLQKKKETIVNYCNYIPSDTDQILTQKCSDLFELFKEDIVFKKRLECSEDSKDNLTKKIKDFLDLVDVERKIPEASCFLGQIYYSERNYLSWLYAIKNFRRSVELEFPEGYFHLGLCYYQGIGVEKSYSQALELFTKSAEKGYSQAYFNLSLMHQDGLSVPKNIEQAKKYLFKCLISEDCNSALRLKQLWKDYPGSLRIYEQCASKGHPEYMYNLSLMYYYGIHVNKDREKSRNLWFEGFQKNNNCLLKLEQSFRDYPQDLKWYHLKAKEGVQNYNYKLGLFYYYGLCGYPKNIQLVKQFWSQVTLEKYQEYIQQKLKKFEMNDESIELAESDKLTEDSNINYSPEEVELFQILNEPKFIKKKVKMISFLNKSFDKIHDSYHLMVEKESINVQNPTCQADIIVRLFKIILKCNVFTEEILFDWYSQYSKKDFVNISAPFWMYLSQVSSIDKENNIVRNLFSLIEKKQSMLTKKALEKDPDFENSNERSNSLFQTIIETIQEIETNCVYSSIEKKNEYLKNKTISKKIHLLELEERKTNNPQSSYFLGLIYNILYVNTDNSKYITLAFLILFKSTILGNIESQFNLGFLYYKGEIVSRNLKAAVSMFKVASLRHQHDASFYLGLIFCQGGPNIDINMDKAIEYWFFGAAKDHQRCIQMLRVQATWARVSYYRKAILEKDYDAYHKIGLMYKHGIRLKKNEGKAIDNWFLGLEHKNDNCLEQLQIHFKENPKQIEIYQKTVKSGFPKFEKRWRLMCKHNLNKI